MSYGQICQRNRDARSSPAGTGLERSAYTLIELLVVLSILAAMAGLTLPLLRRPFVKHYLQSEAQELSEQLAAARLQAMEEGRPVVFVRRPGSSEYQFAYQLPAESATSGGIAMDENSSGSPNAGSTSLSQSPGNAPQDSVAVDGARPQSRMRGGRVAQEQPEERNLADGVQFLRTEDALSAAESGSLADLADSTSGAKSPTGGGYGGLGQSTASDTATTRQSTVTSDWLAPVWFYPDGRCTSQEIWLESEDGYRLEITLRGITGGIRIGRPEPVATAESSTSRQSPGEETTPASSSTE